MWKAFSKYTPEFSGKVTFCFVEGRRGVLFCFLESGCICFSREEGLYASHFFLVFFSVFFSSIFREIGFYQYVHRGDEQDVGGVERATISLHFFYQGH